jgi:outer membrane lipoprotein-sorting protein
LEEAEQTGRTIVQYEKIEVNLDIDDSFFILTPGKG